MPTPTDLASTKPSSSSLLEDRFAMVAHELRGPVHLLGLNMDAMLARIQSCVDETPRAWLLNELDRQRHAIRRLKRLVETLLTSSQLASGGVQLRRESLDLRELVLEVLSWEGDGLRWAGCAYSFEAGGAVFGSWDRLQLNVAISNLLSNAMKYGAGRPVEVSVDADGSCGWVSVRDHGVGIAPQDQDCIFERYGRAHSSSAMAGFGLGLWLVKRIALAHGGDVSLCSAEGDGATFTLNLPRWQKVEANAG